MGMACPELLLGRQLDPFIKTRHSQEILGVDF